jgi:acyl-ACP thioesterase
MHIDSMEAVVEANSKFFDSLVDLVPAKHYYDSDTEKINLKYEKKQARKDHKQAFRVKYKANKRQQLDPDTAITTLKLQQIKKVQDEEHSADGDGPSRSRSLGALTGVWLHAAAYTAIRTTMR